MNRTRACRPIRSVPEVIAPSATILEAMKRNLYFDPNTGRPRYGSGFLSNMIFADGDVLSRQVGALMQQRLLTRALKPISALTSLVSAVVVMRPQTGTRRVHKSGAKRCLLGPICTMKFKYVQLIAQQQLHQSRSHDRLNLIRKLSAPRKPLHR